MHVHQPMEETVHTDLMRFIYREMSATEALDFSQILADDRPLRREFDSLLEAKVSLPKVRFNPSEETLQNILRYSSQTAFETQF